MGGVCEKCGHDIEWHGPNGCDVELRDYGDMDCGCTAYAFGEPVTAPSRQADAALDRLEVVKGKLRDRVTKRTIGAPEVLDTVRDELARLREKSQRQATNIGALYRQRRAAEARVRTLEDGLRRVLEEAPYLDGPEKELIRALLADQPDGCEHEWVSAVNEVVTSGVICRKCKALAADQPDGGETK